MDCIGRLFSKLFTETSLSDFLELDNGCENFSELRACSIFAESSFDWFYLVILLELVAILNLGY